jgi:hypothetical protein
MLKVVISDVRAEVLPILADLSCDVASVLEIVVTLAVASLSPLLALVVAIIALGLLDPLSLLGPSV